MMETGNIDENDTIISEYKIEVSGRDDVMLKLLGKKMNFRFIYVEPPEKVQGQALPADSIDNLTFNGALGMLQRRVNCREIVYLIYECSLVIHTFIRKQKCCLVTLS